MSSKILMIVHFWDKVEIGDEYRKNPHHLTLIPWFKCQDYKVFKADLVKLLKHTQPIKYEIGKIAYFGRKKNIKSSLIKENKKLQQFHQELLNLVLKYDENLKDKYLGKNYKPHIAHKNENHPKEGMKNTIKEIYLIEDIDPRTMLRKVIDKLSIPGFTRTG